MFLQDAAELGEHVEQADVEAVEDITWQVGEQLAREPAVIVKKRLCGTPPPPGQRSLDPESVSAIA